MNPQPKTLIFDIETTNLNADFGYILCIGWRWLKERKTTVFSINQTPEYKKRRTDDSGLLRMFEPVIEAAEVAIYHYGPGFDWPFLQTRRMIHGMRPYSCPTPIDTWRISKFMFKLHSNRLASAAEAAGIHEQKTPLSGPKWIDAMAGYKDAIRYVVEHCRHDVNITYKFYRRAAPFWVQHPAFGISEDERYCRQCRKNSGMPNGVRPTEKGFYQRLRCRLCGFGWSGRRIKNKS